MTFWQFILTIACLVTQDVNSYEWDVDVLPAQPTPSGHPAVATVTLDVMVGHNRYYRVEADETVSPIGDAAAHMFTLMYSQGFTNWG